MLRHVSTRTVAVAQAAYYLPTAAAPLLSRRWFESVTGPKADWWLVITVSWLVAVVGAVLGVAARHSRGAPLEVRLIGAGTATVLCGTDVFYVQRGRISRVYLLDAAAQLVLLVGWLLAYG